MIFWETHKIEKKKLPIFCKCQIWLDFFLAFLDCMNFHISKKVLTPFSVTTKIYYVTCYYFTKTLKKCLRSLVYSLISIRQNYNFDMLAMIWHEIVCWFLKIYQDLKRFAAQEKRIVFVLMFRCAEQFYVPIRQKQSKNGKNLTFDGIIQENIDLSDIY